MAAFKRPRKSGGNSTVCFSFQKGECLRGDTCKYEHSDASPSAAAAPPTKRKSNLTAASGANVASEVTAGTGLTQEICKRFQKNQCVHGAACRFLHEKAPAAAGAGAPKAAPAAEKEYVPPVPAYSSPGPSTGAHITGDMFAALTISSESKRALGDVFKYTNMSAVQSQTLPIIMQGKDCLAKAKTGTGKTLAFLIPTVETIAAIRSKAPASPAAAAALASDVQCLILSPTRELTQQIAKEAEILLTYHRGFKVVSVVGGTNISKDNRALAGRVDFLVATPGRLLDHLQQGLSSR